MGLKLAPKALHQLTTNPKSLELVYPDLVKMSAKMKHMDIISHAEGAALCIQSKKMKGEEGGEKKNPSPYVYLHFAYRLLICRSLVRAGNEQIR